MHTFVLVSGFGLFWTRENRLADLRWTYKVQLWDRRTLGRLESLPGSRQLRKCTFQCVPAECWAFPGVHCCREWTEAKPVRCHESSALALWQGLRHGTGTPPHDLIMWHVFGLIASFMQQQGLKWFVRERGEEDMKEILTNDAFNFNVRQRV